MSQSGDIGRRLKEERERMGLSQAALAERMEVSRKTQYNYEEGAGSPDANYLVSIAALGVDVVYVLTGVSSGVDVARHFSAAAAATLRVGEPDLSDSYLAAAIDQGMNLDDEEKALIAKFRVMPAEERGSFLQVLGILTARRGARSKGIGVKQVIHGDVGQVVKSRKVVQGDINMAGSKRKNREPSD